MLRFVFVFMFVTSECCGLVGAHPLPQLEPGLVVGQVPAAALTPKSAMACRATKAPVTHRSSSEVDNNKDVSPGPKNSTASLPQGIHTTDAVWVVDTCPSLSLSIVEVEVEGSCKHLGPTCSQRKW
jgi:hypothetical protein